MKDSQFCQFKNGKSLTVGCVRSSDDDRGHSDRDKKVKVFQSILRRPVCKENFDKTHLYTKRRDKYHKRGYRRETTRNCI